MLQDKSNLILFNITKVSVCGHLCSSCFDFHLLNFIQQDWAFESCLIVRS